MALEALTGVFLRTLSPDRAAIQQAEVELKALSSQPGYALTVLQVGAAAADPGAAAKRPPPPA